MLSTRIGHLKTVSADNTIDNNLDPDGSDMSIRADRDGFFRVGRLFGGSDANIFNQMGVETLNMSVGYRKPHSKEEYIRVSSLSKCVDIVFNLIRYYSN